MVDEPQQSDDDELNFGKDRTLTPAERNFIDQVLGSDSVGVDPDNKPDFNQGRQDAVSTGTKIRAKVKRGTGTRDQDEIVIEGRGKNAAEAAADFENALSKAEECGWADRLRALQPEGDGDE